MKIVLICIFLLSGWISSPAIAQEEFQIKDIYVQGLSRITADTVFSYLPIGVGDVMNTTTSKNTINALFETGFFKDIRLVRNQGVLIIEVIEHPSIASIEIIGNRNIDDETISRMLERADLIESHMFSEYALETFVRELNNAYISLGRYGVQVESVVTPQEQNQIGVTVEISEGGVARVQKIEFTGNNAYKDNLLKEQSSFHGNRWTNLLFGRNKYSQDKFDSDLEMLRNFYLDRGFLEFEIISNEISISSDKETVLLAIELAEGPRYKIGDIVVDRTNVLPVSEVSSLLKTHEGMIFSRQAIIDSRIAIEKALADVGHAFANVNPVLDTDRDNNSVNIAFVIDPGPQVYVRRINIVGNTSTRDVVIRREMRQLEGAVYSGQKIRRSQERIYRLGFFEDVSFSIEPVAGTTDEIDLNIQVAEAKTGNLLLGLGYSDDEHGFIQAEISRRNLFGSGRGLEISLDSSRIKQVYELEYVNPYYTQNGISRGIYVRQKRVDAGAGSTAGYLANSTGLGLRYRIPTSEYNSLDLSGAYENIDLISVEKTPTEYKSFIDEHPHNLSVVITGGFSRDTRDRILYPQNGHVSQISGETTVPGSDLEYYKLSFRAKWYRQLANNLVLGMGTAFGYGNGYGETDELPFYKNFFAGGASSVRGYSTGSLGPKTAAQSFSKALGGSRRLLANTDLYFPVPGLRDQKKTRLNLFFDVGQVYDHKHPLSFSDLRASAGLAFNWSTAVGPLALSYGIPLNSKEGDQTRKFQITLGTPFR